MFISLNKKILYTIFIFFIVICSIFVYAFYIVYGEKFLEEGRLNLINTKQFTEINFENTMLRQELISLIQNNNNLELSPAVRQNLLENPGANNLNEITREHKRVEDIIKNYDSRYNAFNRAIKVTLLSTLLIIFMIIILGILLRRWILEPINKLDHISDLAASGDLSQRVSLDANNLFTDEFDKLTATFNQMLENLNNSFNEIKEKEKFQQALIDSIPDGIRVIDEDYNIILANKSYYKQIGATASTQPGKCYYSSQKLSQPCPRNNFTCPLWEIQNTPKKNIKVIQQFAPYSNRHLSINAAPMKIDDSPKPQKLYIVESIRDLSEDIKFSHQQKLSSLGFLATSVAHEMKNNLGSIRMIMENILQKFYSQTPDDDEAKKYLTMVQNQIVECINVPERLLKLSRNASEVDSVVNCYNSIKEIIALLDYEAKRKGISINLETTNDQISISGNESDFKMVIINLALNAIKAMNETGELTIKISSLRQQAVIKVIDTGSGIPKNNLPHIFEPFYSDGKKDNQSGTGLGLAIVKSIVEKFHGEIDVKSKENQGTTFTLRFPLYVKNNTK